MLGTRNINHRNFYVHEEPKEEVVEEKKINKPVEEEVLVEEDINEAELMYQELIDLTKKEQIEKLESFGMDKKDIRKLRYEEDRVNKLFELMNR